ncbi:MAG: UDP-N-acetylmuramate--L-alanine ligase [Ignavibacteria bacterium]|nr:UDP-N-acetylmuramate--L-alanine ligase [Ignavibacteria bacterium]
MNTSENIFSGIKNIHLIGISGIGMSGIAEYLVQKKYNVTGSDLNPGPSGRKLMAHGVKVFEGHKAENLSDDTDLVIYTSAVNEDNEELKKSRELNIKAVKRAEALGSIVNEMFMIAVCGTHGKTTTTSMIAKILIDNKLDPTVFVGGNLDFLDGGTSRIGKSNIAIVEADEYDRSFLKLKPDIIVITNIEEDHLDIYKDINDIKESFREFLQNGKKDLKIIACGDDENVTDVIKEFPKKITYGFKKSNDTVIASAGYEKSSIAFQIGSEYLRIKVFGNHNILNSTAAYIAANNFGIKSEGFNESMKTFTGVKRRMELKYVNGIKIYDDYAHHPTEVKVTLEAMRRLHEGRIITVFQPHLYTRTRDFYKEFAEAFKNTDLLLLTKIYPAREESIPGVTSELILKEFNSFGKEGKYYEDNDKLLSEMEVICKDGDVIIFQGAGDITDICSKFIKRMKKNQNWTVPL